ncbi:cytochrome P450 [Mycena galericulata]|nr:cytochrome P450 [Mycena galericulata]
MNAIGRRIISTSKDSVMASQEEKTDGKRDLLSVLLKVNLSSNLPESHRLSDAEVIAQLPVSAREGSIFQSASVSWALHALTQKPAVQSKLRDELFTLFTENPTTNSTLLLVPLLSNAIRLYSPGRIPKGQVMHIPILAVNTDTEIWGDDAAEFIPERWEHIPEAVTSIPRVWANLFGFFAGPDNCIGFRFSLLEYVPSTTNLPHVFHLRFMLIRAFEFEPGTPQGSVVPKAVGLVHRPSVLGDEKGSGLPLIVKPYNAQQY